MIVFDPHPPFLDCLTIDPAGKKTERRILFDDGWQKAIAGCLDAGSRADGIAYVLHQGGEIVLQPSSLVSEGTLALLQEAVAVLPEHNECTYEVCDYLFRTYPTLSHVLLCETAFFT